MSWAFLKSSITMNNAQEEDKRINDKQRNISPQNQIIPNNAPKETNNALFKETMCSPASEVADCVFTSKQQQKNRAIR